MSPRIPSYPHLGAAGATAARRCLVDAMGARQVSGAAAAESFARLLARTRPELSDLFGEQGTVAVFGRAAHLCRTRCPALVQAIAGSQGASFETYATDLDATAVRDCLTDYYLTMLDVVCSLIGWDLVEPMVARIAGPLRDRRP